MTKKVSTTVIGGFVITAITLLIAAVVLFGVGAFWKQTELYVLHFEESIRGLTVGSSVMFRGVQIGTVKSIMLQTDNELATVAIPVVIEINEEKFRYQDRVRPDFKQYFALLIENGLRAQLHIQSIVTGQLLIQLDFHPDTEIRLSNIDSRYVEIPTIRSPLSELGIALQEVPAKEIITNILEISKQIEEILAGEEINKFLRDMSSAAENTNILVKDTGKLVIKIDDKIDVFSRELDQSLENVETILAEAMKSVTMAADSASEMLTSIDREVVPLAAKLSLTLDAATKALEHADTTMRAAEKFIERSDTRIKINHTLDEISAAARSMKALTDYLERHPEALLMGKSGGEN